MHSCVRKILPRSRKRYEYVYSVIDHESQNDEPVGGTHPNSYFGGTPPPPRLNVMDFLKNRANFVKQDIVYSRINDPVVPKVPKLKLR